MKSVGLLMFWAEHFVTFMFFCVHPVSLTFSLVDLLCGQCPPFLGSIDYFERTTRFGLLYGFGS